MSLWYAAHLVLYVKRKDSVVSCDHCRARNLAAYFAETSQLVTKSAEK